MARVPEVSEWPGDVVLWNGFACAWKLGDDRSPEEPPGSAAPQPGVAQARDMDAVWQTGRGEGVDAECGRELEEHREQELTEKR